MASWAPEISGSPTLLLLGLADELACLQGLLGWGTCCCCGVVGRVVSILPSFIELCGILCRNTGKAEIPWTAVSRTLALVTKVLCVVSLLSRTAVLVAIGMHVVTADRGKYIEMCAYLSIVPAASGMQQLADHSKGRRM